VSQDSITAAFSMTRRATCSVEILAMSRVSTTRADTRQPSHRRGVETGAARHRTVQQSIRGTEFQAQSVHHAKQCALQRPSTALLESQRVVRVAYLSGESADQPAAGRISSKFNCARPSPTTSSQPTSIETIYSSTICTFAARGLGVAVINPYRAAVFKDRLCVRPFRPPSRHDLRCGCEIHTSF
jgi:hypothetical protein